MATPGVAARQAGCGRGANFIDCVRGRYNENNSYLLRSNVQALYLDHHGWLESWLRRQVGCRHQAADLSQDTFEQLLRQPQRLTELREPRAYLAVVAKRVLLNFWRRRDLERAYLEALAALPEDLAPSAEDRVTVLQALERIDAVLQGLPPKVRRVFLLNQIEDMGYQAIADEVGMPVISVRRAMARAIAACLELD